MINYSSKELGNILGKAIKESDEYRQTLAQSEEVTDINISGVNRVKVAEAIVEKKKFIIGCSISGENGGINPFVLNHVVSCNLDSSSLYIDGTWCSEEIFYKDYTNYYDFLIDENNDFIVDNAGNFIIGIA